jgi:hypothetical protein
MCRERALQLFKKTFPNGMPEEFHFVDMAEEYTMFVNGKSGKRVINPETLIGKMLREKLVKPKQIITIERERSVVNLNNKAKTGIRNELGDFFKVMHRLTQAGVKIGFICQDMMCMPTANFAKKQAFMFSDLSNQGGACGIDLTLSMKSQFSSTLKGSAISYLKKVKQFNSAMRKMDHKASVWNLADVSAYRYISSRTPMEVTAFVMERNYDFSKTALKVKQVKEASKKQSTGKAGRKPKYDNNLLVKVVKKVNKGKKLSVVCRDLGLPYASVYNALKTRPPKMNAKKSQEEKSPMMVEAGNKAWATRLKNERKRARTKARKK